jgi:hypothetical protein
MFFEEGSTYRNFLMDVLTVSVFFGSGCLLPWLATCSVATIFLAGQRQFG